MQKLYTIILITYCVTAFSQVSNWQWANSANGTSNDMGNSIAIDAMGNSYVIGDFSSPTLTFGSITLKNAGSILGSNDVFVVKYDASGNVVWVKNAIGTGDDRGRSIAVDINGYIYITGNFQSPTITFGDIILTNANNSGTSDIFIVKYNEAGNALWAKHAGVNNGNDASSSSITLDSNGNFYITGGFSSASFTLGSTTLTNSNPKYSDIFVAKFDPLGNVVWAKSAGGNNFDFGKSIKVDASGNVYVIGNYYSYIITFGNISLTTSVIGSCFSCSDIFIVKYDAFGQEIWAKITGGTSEDNAKEIVVDANKNLYITGYFMSPTIIFDKITLTNADNTSNSDDIFLAKLDSSGNTVWAKRYGGNYFDESNSISLGANQDLFITGYFSSPSVSFGNTVLTNTDNSSHIFVAKYNSIGDVLEAISVTGNSVGASNSIVSNVNGNSYLTGYFYSDSIAFSSTNLINSYSWAYDFFIAKLGGLVGIDKNTTTDLVNIYPNPANKNLTIRLLVNSQQPSVIKIYNVFGESVWTSPSPLEGNGEWSVDVSKLMTGIYFAQVRTEKGIITKKIIKQ